MDDENPLNDLAEAVLQSERSTGFLISRGVTHQLCAICKYSFAQQGRSSTLITTDNQLLYSAASHCILQCGQRICDIHMNNGIPTRHLPSSPPRSRYKSYQPAGTFKRIHFGRPRSQSSQSSLPTLNELSSFTDRICTAFVSHSLSPKSQRFCLLEEIRSIQNQTKQDKCMRSFFGCSTHQYLSLLHHLRQVAIVKEEIVALYLLRLRTGLVCLVCFDRSVSSTAFSM
jgi:hypothetical protein